jgi:16S rRNA (guanine966-N2)-methyltransferase
MRIIAGALKGRRLAPVHGRIRPTAAKVRESVFNILGDAVLGVRVLDLFAGTGALGIEALSRGAAATVFVEDHPGALKVLRRNLEDLGLGGQATVWPLPVMAALKKLAGRGEGFDLAFLDPPYGGGEAEAALKALASLGPGGGRTQPPAGPAGRVWSTAAPSGAALWRHPGGFLSGGKTRTTGASITNA